LPRVLVALGRPMLDVNEREQSVGQAQPVTERGRASLETMGDEAMSVTRDSQPGTRDLSWYALHVRSNQEKRARDYLQSRDVEVFLPLYRVQSRRRDRRMVVEKPLFTGYLFVHSDLKRSEKIELLRAPGSVGLVGFDDGPRPVPDSELDSIRILVGSGRVPEPFPFLKEGKRVRVTGGALDGLEGYVVHAADGKRRVVVSIEILGRSVAALLEREELEPAGG
jgi:transcription termination/antitermination protein NusG